MARKHNYVIGYEGDRQIVYGKNDSQKNPTYTEPLTEYQAKIGLKSWPYADAVVYKLVKVKKFGKSKGKTMKTVLNTVIVSLVIAMLAGCQTTPKELKASFGDAKVIFTEVSKMERAKGHDSTADKIDLLLTQVQAVVDANDIEGNCPMLQATADVAYEWVSEEYPQTIYPVMLALLKQRLSQYCSGETVQ